MEFLREEAVQGTSLLSVKRLEPLHEQAIAAPSEGDGRKDEQGEHDQHDYVVLLSHGEGSAMPGSLSRQV
jgi:hypothetical protein